MDAAANRRGAAVEIDPPAFPWTARFDNDVEYTRPEAS